MKIVITFLSLLFFYYPTIFSLRNFEEYGQSYLINLLAFYGIGFTFSCIFISSIYYFKLDLLIKIIFPATIWISLYPLLANYHFGNLQHWKLSRFQEVIDSTLWLQKIEIIILIGLFVLTLLFWKKIQHLIPFILIFIHFTYITHLVIESRKIYLKIQDHQIRLTKESLDFQEVYALSSEKNILVFVPDMMSGTYFQKVLHNQPDFQTAFDGFTFFPHSISVGNTTHASVHAIHGGELGTPEEIMRQKPQEMKLVEYWQKHAPSFLDDFEKNGWNVMKISHVPNHQGDNGKRPTRLFPLLHLLGQRETSLIKPHVEIIELIQFSSFMLFKASPLLVKKYIYRDGMFLIPSQNFQENSIKSNDDIDFPHLTEKVKQFHSNHHYGLLAYFKGWLEYGHLSSQKPVIHYAHTMLTHFPYYAQPDCSTKGNKYHVNSAEGNYNNVSCQMTLFQKMIEKLKDLGVYDQTMIIIVSDHANHAPDNKAFGLDMMLAVKPFGKRGKLVTSQARVITSDIPAIACDAIGGCPQYGGINPFKNPQFKRKFQIFRVGWPPDFKEMTEYVNLRIYEVEGDLYSEKNFRQIK